MRNPVQGDTESMGTGSLSPLSHNQKAVFHASAHCTQFIFAMPDCRMYFRPQISFCQCITAFLATYFSSVEIAPVQYGMFL